jgi:hypothetical protein
MGLNIGKFVSRILDPKKIMPVVSAFTGGGIGAASSLALSQASFGTPRPAVVQNPMTASLRQPSQGFGGGMSSPMNMPQTVKNQVMKAGPVPGDVFNALLKVADRLGIRIANPNSVVSVGRNLLAKLIRFSRATPGLTIVSMLLNLGLTALEANQLVTWYSTAGKRRKRIRVTNVKALNRSVRRLEGFTRLARRVEASLARRSVGRSLSRKRRCFKCRKSPCSC